MSRLSDWLAFTKLTRLSGRKSEMKNSTEENRQINERITFKM